MSDHIIFFKRVLLTGIVRIVAVIKSLFLLSIITKNLGASNYGIFVQVITTVLFLQPFVELGLGSSIVRFLSSKNKEEIIQGIITILSIVLLAGIITSLGLYLLSGNFANLFLKEESAEFIVKLASPLVMLDPLIAISLNSFRIFGQVKKYFEVSILQSLLEISFIICSVSLGFGLVGIFVSTLFTRLIILIIILHLLISYAGFKIPNFRLIKPYLIYSFPFIFTAVFEIVIALSDRYVIGFYMGSKDVGIYAASYSIGSIISVYSALIMYVLYPTLSNYYDKGLVREINVYLSYTWKYLMMLLIPSFFGLSILSSQLVSIFATSEFVFEGKYIVVIISLSMIFNSLYSLYGGIILLTKNTHIFALSCIFSGLLNLLLNILFVPIYGIIAAAVSTLISYLISAMIIYIYSRSIKFHIDYRFLVKSIFSSIIMTYFIWLYNPQGNLETLISVIIGCIVYFSILLLSKGFDEIEMETIYKIVNLE